MILERFAEIAHRFFVCFGAHRATAPKGCAPRLNVRKHQTERPRQPLAKMPRAHRATAPEWLRPRPNVCKHQSRATAPRSHTRQDARPHQSTTAPNGCANVRTSASIEQSHGNHSTRCPTASEQTAPKGCAQRLNVCKHQSRATATARQDAERTQNTTAPKGCANV